MNTMDLSSFVTKLLFFLGFSPKTKGFNYTREMVSISYFDRRLSLNQIYALISEKNGQPTEAIQTAIRTALKNAQSTKAFKRLDGLICANVIQPNYLVATREFLGLISEYLFYFWDKKPEIGSLLNDVKYDIVSL